MKQIDTNPSINVNTLISAYTPLGPGAWCPTNTVVGTVPHETAGKEMMYHSDNTHTREIVDYFGVSNINNLITSLGMASTSINHIFGCGGPDPNEATLNDLAALYRQVDDGSQLSGWYKLLFYSWMAGTWEFLEEGYDWTGIYDTELPTIINQEARSGSPRPRKTSSGKKHCWRIRLVIISA